MTSQPKDTEDAEPKDTEEAVPDPEVTETQEENEEEQRQKQIQLLLQDPQTFADIVLEFDLESPSDKMQKYLQSRRQQYIDAHTQFKQNQTKIMNQCNQQISDIATRIRQQIQTSNKALQDILATFSNEDQLLNMSHESEVTQCWLQIEKEFNARQCLFDEFTTNSTQIKDQRTALIQSQIQNLFQTCVNTGLLPPQRIQQSLKPKVDALHQVIQTKTNCYQQLTMRLKEKDAKLKDEYQDQYKDGTLRWNQLHRNENIPKDADSKSCFNVDDSISL
eukprot:92813_1